MASVGLDALAPTEVECVVVSPLRRAVHTALLALPSPGKQVTPERIDRISDGFQHVSAYIRIEYVHSHSFGTWHITSMACTISNRLAFENLIFRKKVNFTTVFAQACLVLFGVPLSKRRAVKTNSTTTNFRS